MRALRRASGLAGLLALLLLSVPLRAEAPILLRYRFTPGQVLRYGMEVRANARLGSTALPPYVLEQDYGIELEVLSVEPNGAARIEIRQKLQRNRVLLSRQELPVAAPEVSTTRFQLRVEPNGSGFVPLGSSIPGSQTAAAAWLLFPAFPERPMAAGHSWTTIHETALSVAGGSVSSRYNARYTYDGPDRQTVPGSARVAAEVKLRIPTPGHADKQRPATITGSGEGHGCLYFREGRLVYGTLEGTSATDSRLPLAGGAGFSLPLDTTFTARLRLIS